MTHARDAVPYTHRREHRRRVQQVQEQGTDTAVNIHDKVGSLGKGVALYCEGVIQILGGREVTASIILQQLHSLVPVVLHRCMTELSMITMQDMGSMGCNTDMLSSSDDHVPTTHPQ